MDEVLECLRSEMVILAEFEASKATSAHQVAEYASQIAESMHTREQMLETMYQRLGTLSSFLGPEDVVLVGMGDPPESLVQDVLQSSHYGGKVRYFKGSLMSQKDLHSMELRKAIVRQNGLLTNLVSESFSRNVRRCHVQRQHGSVAQRKQGLGLKSRVA